MLKKFIILSLALVLITASFSSCNLLSPGEGWQTFGHTYKKGVNHSSPKLAREDENSSISHADACEVEIGMCSGGTYNGAEGHYVFKNAAIIKTLTIDGEDYTIRVPLTEDGEGGGFTSHIHLKRDTEKSKITSGYIRDSGFEGFYKIVPHTLVEGKTYEPTCLSAGYTEKKCTECSYIEKINIKDALEHTPDEENKTCTVCNQSLIKEDNTQTPNGSSGINYISCSYTPIFDLDVDASGLGVVTGTLDIKVNNPEVVSDVEYRSTKEHIIKIEEVTSTENTLTIKYLVLGHGEADILVRFISESLNRDELCEIHFTISDK
jgi:hypothetical protein